MSAREKQSGFRVAAVGIWLLVFLIITGDVIRRPLSHTTTPTYRHASTHWWAGIDIYTYDPHAGFFYFPQAAILFTPFTWGPYLCGEILWRVAVFALFAYALLRLGRFFIGRENPLSPRAFLALTLLAVPSSMASLRNAQFDLPLAALVVLAAAEVATARWTAAACWLCLALALKPLAVVPLLLFGALYARELVPRLAIGLVITLLVPFLNLHPGFVAHEYFRCGQTLLWAAQPHEPKFSDLPALLSRVQIALPDKGWTGLRLLFALGFLGLGAIAVRRLVRLESAWAVGALSTIYLMLFNPRTETCSYVFLAPFVAALALIYLHRGDRKWLGYALCFGSLCLACDAIPVVHYATDRWLKPLVAVLFLPVVIEFIFGRRSTSGQAVRIPETPGAPLVR
jgi:alpha-1,2-mannosyltransferase